MALEPIRPKDLPPSVTVYATDRIPSDDGVNVGGALPVQIVDAGAPVPSEATAIAGIDNVSRMTPFLTRAVLNNEIAPSVLLAQAWAESPTPPIPGSESSKTWAGQAEVFRDQAAISAAQAALYDGPRFGTIALMQAGTGFADGKFVRVDKAFNGEQEGFVYDAASTLTADGALVVTPDTLPGRFISTRTVYADWAEMDADVRTLPNGTDITVNGVGEFVTVGTGEDLTLTGGLKVTIRVDDEGALSASSVGCDAGAADNSAALAKLYAINPKAVSFDKFYPVTGNFARADIPHYGVGGVTIGVVDIPLNSVVAHADLTVYVDPAGSDTANHGLSAAYPFKTLNRAEKSLPKITFDFQQVVSMSAGVFDQSYTPAGDMARPAILFPGQRLRRRRSAQNGSVLDAAIVYRGQGDTTIVRSNPVAGYPYGVYLTGAEAAFEKFKIEPAASGSTAALLTSHRTDYAHLSSVTIDGSAGAGVALGTIVEAGGSIEAINCTMTGATSDDLFIYTGGRAVISGPTAGTVGKVTNQGIYRPTAGITHTGRINSTGGEFRPSGSIGSKVIFNAAVTIEGSYVLATYTKILNNLFGIGCSYFRWSACELAGLVDLRDTMLLGDGSTTFEAGVGQSTVATPIVLRGNSSISPETTLEIRNNTGALIGPVYESNSITVSADSTVLTLNINKLVTTVLMTGTGAGTRRAGCTLAAVTSLQFASQPVPDRAIVHIACKGIAVEIANGTTAQLPGSSVTIGANNTYAGSVSGLTLMYDATSAKWREIGRGAVWP